MLYKINTIYVLEITCSVQPYYIRIADKWNTNAGPFHLNHCLVNSCGAFVYRESQQHQASRNAQRKYDHVASNANQQIA